MTTQQRRDALKVANQVKSAAVRARRNIRSAPTAEASCEYAAWLISNPPQTIRGMGLEGLLKAVQGMGSRHVDGCLDIAGVDNHARLGDLTVTQRVTLAALLRGRGRKGVW